MSAHMKGSLELRSAQVSIDGRVHTLAGVFQRERMLVQALSSDARAWLLGTFAPELAGAASVRVTCEGTWRYHPLFCRSRLLEEAGRLDVTAAVHDAHKRLHEALVRRFVGPVLLRVQSCGRAFPPAWHVVPEAPR